MMPKKSKQNNSKARDFPQHFVFLIIILLFLATNITFAFHLQREIVPDEHAHIRLTEAFDTTLGIPGETEEILMGGNVIEGNPFLYYWILARFRNFVKWIFPSITNERLFLVSRAFNSFLSAGTLFVIYLLARAVIKKPWLTLLPSFIMANLQTFFMVSAGINYDNLNNLLCAIAIYLIIKIVKQDQQAFWLNSFGLAIVLGLAGLTKKTSLPLIVIIFFIWLFYVIKNKPAKVGLNFLSIFLIILAVLSVGANIYMYGRNLLVYKTLVPHCFSVKEESFCVNSNYYVRWLEAGQLEKLSYAEVKEQGLPGLLDYFVNHWMKVMLSRNIGAFGHKVWENPLIESYQLALILIAMMGLSQIRKPKMTVLCLLIIALVYTVFLYLYNYNEQLFYAFAGFGIQGRYIYPVIPAFLVIITRIVEELRPKFMFYFTQAAVVLITILGGPVQFLYYYKDYFYTWF